MDGRVARAYIGCVQYVSNRGGCARELTCAPSWCGPTDLGGRWRWWTNGGRAPRRAAPRRDVDGWDRARSGNYEQPTRAGAPDVWSAAQWPATAAARSARVAARGCLPAWATLPPAPESVVN